MASVVPPRRVYQRNELLRLLSPKSIAIVGASPTPTSFAASTLDNLRFFDGPVMLVNAKYQKIGDKPCYPSISALPQVPDCVILTIGRDSVQPIVEECAARGVGGVVIFASGYSETAKPERVALQNRLTEIARESGMKIVGPNCVGDPLSGSAL